MTGKQRILIFINSLQIGGSERVVSLLLNHLKDDFDLHLAMYHNIVEYDIPAETKILDLHQPQDESKISMFLKAPALANTLSDYCRRHDISTTVAFLYRPCFVTALMKKWYGFTGCVIMCERTHQTTFLKRHNWFFRFITRNTVRFAYQNADLVLTNARAMKLDLVNNLEIKTPVRVIHNPVDMKAIGGQSDEDTGYQFDKNLFYFITVGRFRKEKNFSMLVDAFALLDRDDCRLVMVGGGEELEKCKARAIEKGVENMVHFAGFQRNPFKYMAKSDCFVLSSDVEGYPNVLLEALACGLPVISTDCNSGPVELLHPGFSGGQFSEVFHEGEYGLLSPVNDPVTLAEAMMRIYSDQELRTKFRSRAVERATEFNISNSRQQFQEAFSSACKA